MKESITDMRRRYAMQHALDGIAVPLIPTVGVELAYRVAIDRVKPPARVAHPKDDGAQMSILDMV
jgi:hypothetical protein